MISFEDYLALNEYYAKHKNYAATGRKFKMTATKVKKYLENGYIPMEASPLVKVSDDIIARIGVHIQDKKKFLNKELSFYEDERVDFEKLRKERHI